MQSQVIEQDPEWEDTMRREEEENSRQEFFESWGMSEDLRQIQEKGLDLNREARIRTLPSAEDLVKEVSQSKEKIEEVVEE